MTNKKIKNYAKDHYAAMLINETWHLLSAFLMALNKLDPKHFGKTGLTNFCQNYTDTCAQYKQYEADEIYEYKFNENLDCCGIDKEALLLLAINLTSTNNKYPSAAYSANLGTMCIHTHEHYGYGKTRLNRVLEMMKETYPTSLEDVEKIGVEIEVEYITYESLIPKKNKISFSEEREIAKSVKEMKEYLEWERGNVND